MTAVRRVRRGGVLARAVTISALSMSLGCAARAGDAAGGGAPVSAAPVAVVALGPSGYTLDGARVVSAEAVADELAERGARAARIELLPGAELEELVRVMERLRARHITDVQLVRVTSSGASQAEPGSAEASDGEPVDVSDAASGDAAPAGSVAVAQPAPPPTPAEPPAEVESLPEVVIKNIGFHIGGGTNTDEEKAPFRAAIEQRFDDLRRCYKLVEEPAKGGVFGVDLRVGRAGGRGTVSQPRTSMRGQPFRDCVIRAFESVEFERPAKGPTVFSYSIRFTMGG